MLGSHLNQCPDHVCSVSTVVPGKDDGAVHERLQRTQEWGR